MMIEKDKSPARRQEGEQIQKRKTAPGPEYACKNYAALRDVMHETNVQ